MLELQLSGQVHWGLSLPQQGPSPVSGPSWHCSMQSSPAENNAFITTVLPVCALQGVHVANLHHFLRHSGIHTMKFNKVCPIQGRNIAAVCTN